MQTEIIDKRLRGWTEARVEKLTELFKSGLTASKIAEQLGEVTRNSVIGKIDRLGLRHGGKAAPEKAAAPVVDAKPVTPKPDRRGNGGMMLRISLGRREKKQFITRDVANAEPRHIGLDELTAETCRWPFGDGPFTFCGCAPIEGKPYCAAHHAAAYHKRLESEISDEERKRRADQWRANAEMKRRQQQRHSRQRTE